MTGESTVAEIEATGGIALGIEIDVRDHEAVEAMVARVVQEWGRVDVLVVNAGGGRGRPMDTKASSVDPALLRLVTEMNLFGTVYSCNAVAPVMKQQRSGKIITVSSVAGTATSADGGYAHYGAAKAAIAISGEEAKTRGASKIPHFRMVVRQRPIDCARQRTGLNCPDAHHTRVTVVARERHCPRAEHAPVA
jgi:NAD(P)-dependent dehydrogenase (short-subunit alcohol dehydrogenase family)